MSNLSTNKIIRSVCYFSKSPTEELLTFLNSLSDNLTDHNYQVQTKRLVSPDLTKIFLFDKEHSEGDYLFSAGTLPKPVLVEKLNNLLDSNNIYFNLDLTRPEIESSDAEILFEIMKSKPGKTFNFAYVFNNPGNSPYFPSANYASDGFSLGLQSTDLYEGCLTVDEWLSVMKDVWNEIMKIFSDNPEFLGIDSSIAPLNSGNGSFLSIINSLGTDFNRSVLTDIYLKITRHLKTENPKPAGLCGLMLPALEDKVLAEEYSKGNFSLERNLFLSLHSGLGIDTYPIGIDEKVENVVSILNLVQGLSNKFQKSLSVRFVSDGKAAIGDKTDFQNQYLEDVTVRSL